MGEPDLVRSPSARVLLGPGLVWVLGGTTGSDCRLDGDSGELVLAILGHAGTPTSRDAIVRSVLVDAGADPSQRQPVDDAVTLLIRMGALVLAADLAPPARARHVGNVLVCITGAVGAVYSPRLVHLLVDLQHSVRVAMTRSARRFIAPRAFAALTHREVTTGMWGGPSTAPAPHVELAQWADVVVISPCTATTISRIAAGDCSELVSAVATTTRAPVLLAPSMNTEMLHAPQVAENLGRLRRAGFFVAYPGNAHEVADAPRERVGRMGGGAPAVHVVRYVELLVERAAAGEPRLPSQAEWNSDHTRRAIDARDHASDADVLVGLARYAPLPSRVLDVGTGLGEVARAAARAGHVVVATDFSETAIERAHAVAPELPITWLVDDATDSHVRGSFDVCIDRACLVCIPASKRERYVTNVAALVRSGGTWLLKVYSAPRTAIRAHAFTREDIAALVSSRFEVAAARKSTLSFGNSGKRAAWMFDLRRL